MCPYIRGQDNYENSNKTLICLLYDTLTKKSFAILA